MPITPNPAAPAAKVDVNLREHLSFNPASQETIQRTNLAKSFLEDYYKQIPVRAPKIEEEPPVVEDVDDKKKIKKSSSNKKIKEHKPASPQITRPFSVMHHAHVGFVKGTGLQVQNLPNDLREFVEDLNTSLGIHGAENITEEELKMVLASAKLPHSASAPTPLSSQPPLPRNDEEVVDIHEKIDSNMNSIIDTFTPPSSPAPHSAPSNSTPSTPSAASPSLASSSSSISSSSASSTPTLPSTPQKTSKPPAPSHPPPPYPTYDNAPSTPNKAANTSHDNMSVNVGKDSEKGKDKDSKDKDNKAQSGGERSRAPSRTRKFTQFFTGKVVNEPPAGKRLSRSLSESSSKTTKTEPLHHTHDTPQKPTAPATATAAPAHTPASAPAPAPTPAAPAGFERATPKGAKATNFEISSPRNFAKVGGFDFGGDSMKDMKVKLELADKALRNEAQLRLAAEEKTTSLEKQVTELKLELEHAKNQASTFSTLLEEANAKFTASTSWHKQADSEINMLRRKIAIKTKSEEDTIASESKKRRLLEVQIVELKAQLQQLQRPQQKPTSATTTTTNDTSAMNKLVADVKAQLANADAELQLVKGQLNDERTRAQEENEAQRKELESAKAAFEVERKSWIETRLRLEANLEATKAEATRKVDEITKQLEGERKQRKVEQMMYETLLARNEASTSPSTSPPQTPTESPAPSPLLTTTTPPTTSVPPISPPLSSSSDSTPQQNATSPEEDKVANPRYSSPLPPGPPTRPAPPSTAHPSTPGLTASVPTTTTTKPAPKQSKAKDGTKNFFRSGKK